MHLMTQKICATPLCLEQELSMLNSLLYGCILFLEFDLFGHLVKYMQISSIHVFKVNNM